MKYLKEKEKSEWKYIACGTYGLHTVLVDKCHHKLILNSTKPQS